LDDKKVMRCIFCDIIEHKLAADIVYEDNTLIAFLDIKPLFHGHTLLVPKVHHETLWDLPEPILAELMKKAQALSVAIKIALKAEGIFMANNNIVSQSIPHFHMHLIPRNKKDESDAHKLEVKEKIIKCL
jgi:histidine triad (HIT) family protein